MPVKVVCIGKNKNNVSKELIDEYLKRIKPYTDIEMVYLADIPLKKSGEISEVIKKESEKIVKYIDSRRKGPGKLPYFVLLDREGIMPDSVKFAEMIDSNLQSNELHFIIGGVYGVGSDLKKAVDTSVSISPMTFTHLMTRVILLEQIYRSLTIINNKKYHY